MMQLYQAEGFFFVSVDNVKVLEIGDLPGGPECPTDVSYHKIKRVESQRGDTVAESELTCLGMCAAPKAGVARRYVSTQSFQKECIAHTFGLWPSRTKRVKTWNFFVLFCFCHEISGPLTRGQ